MKSSKFRLAAAAFSLLIAAPAQAVITPSSGYIYSGQLLASPTQSCVAVGPGGTFVAIGPGFTANGQALAFVQESGAARLVAFGFNSVSDCYYDAATDTLYVTDNADSGELTGALTGDTVFRISSASTASGLSAEGLELLVENSVPSAAGVTVGPDGNVYVGNALGAPNGEVVQIALPAATPSSFVTGLDLAGGLVFEAGSGELFAADTLLATFPDARIQRFDALGMPLGIFAGPSTTVGSYDLAFNTNGSLLATGTSNVRSFDSLGSPSTFASGLGFSTGVSVNDFTGRVEVLASPFPPSPDGSSIHRFVPIDELVAGKGSTRTECVHELYGLELVPPEPSRPATQAICTDGAACDADGKQNDRCLFPVGFCLNVSDPDFPDCTPTSVTAFSAASKPNVLDAQAAAAAVDAALPVAGPSCFFSDGITVPVKITASGKKAGKGKISTKATNADGDIDADNVVLVCNPAP